MAIVTLFGEEYQIERRGTDGDRDAFVRLLEDLDGEVDAIGIGGADLYVVSGERKYEFREIRSLISVVKETPIVDGSGLKHTLEREAIRWLGRERVIDWPNTHVLLVSAVDRYGMAQALDEAGAHVVYGDLLFGLGLPLPVRSYEGVKKIAHVALPLITKLPLQWFYPTGAKQETRAPKHPKAFAEASVIAGDWHYIRRYAPDDLSGKTVITQTVRSADLDWLRTTGATQVITTTPVIDGETFATNVMEAVIVAMLGKPADQVSENDFLETLAKLDWHPTIIPLSSPVD
ncbi:MAG: hypothetical protein KF812_01190 [Fimbriimonadaceae bacterium]|nr:hypothetical protein [Fimbriimonadaceae bacterium]